MARNSVAQQVIGTGDGTISVAPSANGLSGWIDISAYKSVAIYVATDQSYDLTYSRSHNGLNSDQSVSVATAQAAVPTNTTRYHPLINTSDAVPFIKITIKNDGASAANTKVYLVGTPI